MPLKGFAKFRSKTPAFTGKRVVLLPFFIILVLGVAFTVYLGFDSLPDILYRAGMDELFLAFLPLFGVLIIGNGGFILVLQMWLWRDHLKKKYGASSYQHIFLVGFCGIVLLLTVAFHQYLAFYQFSPSYWAVSPFRFLAVPFDTLLGSAAPVIMLAKSGLSLILLGSGILMIARAIQIFGLDYMTVVYLYFPEESELQNHEIYSVIRHPTYTGALLISLGGTIFTLTAFSLVFYVFFLIVFYVHVHFVEERELIHRFGDSYRDYRREVPAFFVKPRNLKKMLNFLFKPSK